jgi:hypothetical protein
MVNQTVLLFSSLLFVVGEGGEGVKALVNLQKQLW